MKKNFQKIMYITTFCLLLTVSLSAQTSIKIVSDNTWKANANLTKGWETIAFNDAFWNTAQAPNLNEGSNCLDGNGFQDPDVKSMWVSGGTSNKTAYCRHSFDVPVGMTSDSAIIVVGAYQDVTVWINGIAVITDTNKVATPLSNTADVHSLLIQGKNVIAVKANSKVTEERICLLFSAHLIQASSGVMDRAEKSHSINVYPNPLSKEDVLLHINGSSLWGEQAIVLDILDVTGRCIRRMETTAVKMQEGISLNLQAGLYVLNINSANDYSHTPFVVQ